MKWQSGSRSSLIPRAPPDLTLSGLSDEWKSPTGERVRSCTVITCDPNAKVGALHDHMPVILEEKDWPKWLGREPALPRGPEGAAGAVGRRAAEDVAGGQGRRQREQRPAPGRRAAGGSSAPCEPMARFTYFVVLPFSPDEDGILVASEGDGSTERRRRRAPRGAPRIPGSRRLRHRDAPSFSTV
jgi:hypothetical protein